MTMTTSSRHIYYHQAVSNLVSAGNEEEGLMYMTIPIKMSGEKDQNEWRKG